MPGTLITDCGTAFQSQAFRRELSNNGITHARVSPYRPQTNRLVECTNLSLTDILYVYVNEAHTDWDEHISYAGFTISTAKHTSTLTTPLELVYSQMPVLPQESQLSLTWERRGQEYGHKFQQHVDDARRRSHLARLACMPKIE